MVSIIINQKLVTLYT